MENGRPHWTQRPGGMLAAAVLATFALYLAGMAATLPLSLAGPSLPGGGAGLLFAALRVFQLCVAPGLALLFYFFMRRLQRKHGSAEPVPWKAGAAFWVGLAFVLLCLPLYGSWALASPESLLYALGLLSGGFSAAVIFVLLFPAMERKFGPVKGSILISAAFAGLSVCESLVTRAASTLLNILVYNETLIPTSMIWRGIAASLASGFIMSAALTMARCSLYLAASRRVTGTWMLFSSVPTLLSLLYNTLWAALPGSSGLAWLTVLCVELPYCLLVFALCLGAVAGYMKWKTFTAFTADLRAFLKKARRTQNDIEE